MNLIPVQHRLIGRPDQVAAVLRAAQARGHLLGLSPAESLPGCKVAVTVTLLQPPINGDAAAGPQTVGQGLANRETRS